MFLTEKAFYFSDNTVIHVDETIMSFRKGLRTEVRVGSIIVGASS